MVGNEKIYGTDKLYTFTGCLFNIYKSLITRMLSFFNLSNESIWFSIYIYLPKIHKKFIIPPKI